MKTESQTDYEHEETLLITTILCLKWILLDFWSKNPGNVELVISSVGFGWIFLSCHLSAFRDGFRVERALDKQNFIYETSGLRLHCWHFA